MEFSVSSVIKGDLSVWMRANEKTKADHAYRALNCRTPRSALSFSPDSTRLAVATHSSCEVWDARTWARIRQFQGHADAVVAVQFSPDGLFLASASRTRPSVCGI